MFDFIDTSWMEPADKIVGIAFLAVIGVITFVLLLCCLVLVKYAIDELRDK